MRRARSWFPSRHFKSTITSGPGDAGRGRLHALSKSTFPIDHHKEGDSKIRLLASNFPSRHFQSSITSPCSGCCARRADGLSKSTFPIDHHKIEARARDFARRQAFQVDISNRPSQEPAQYSPEHLLLTILLRALPAKMPPRHSRHRAGSREITQAIAPERVYRRECSPVFLRRRRARHPAAGQS